MTDDEDYEFSIATSTGLRNVVISKMALGRITGGDHAWSDALIVRHHDEITAIVERKIAKGGSGAGRIRINATFELISMRSMPSPRTAQPTASRQPTSER
jgi:hypothetical protein